MALIVGRLLLGAKQLSGQLAQSVATCGPARGYAALVTAAPNHYGGNNGHGQQRAQA